MDESYGKKSGTGVLSGERSESVLARMLSQLEDITSGSEELCSSYGSLLLRLDNIYLKADEPQKCSSEVPVDPSTNIINRVKKITERLEFVNRKNAEIIDNLKTTL